MTSFGAKAINLYLRFAGLKKSFQTAENAKIAIAKDRAKGPAGPNRWIKKNCDITQYDLDGFRNYMVKPRKNQSTHHVIYFHGGGYALDIVSFHWHFIAKLIRQTGATVTVPVYPLAPDYDWSTSYPVMMKLYEHVLNETDSQNLTFMGDSAGGGWSLGLAQMLRDQGKPMPGQLVLLSPWLDGTAGDPMQPEIESRDHIVSVEGIRRLGRWWAGSATQPDAFPVSPINASMDNLPPMIAFSGTHDILYADALALKDKAEKADAALDLHIYPEMQHVWMLFPIREAKLVLDQITVFLER